jgi:CBS domain-containing protein
MPVTDLARADVVTADPETPVPDLAERMADENVGSIVITEGDEPVGIVTDRDLAVRALTDAAPTDLVAEDVLSEGLVTVPADAGFYEATELMSEHGVRRLPVTNDGGLAGIVTADDLHELLADEQEQFADVIRAQRPAY